MTATAIAINTFLSKILDRKDIIEMYLSFGASRWEAAKPIAIEAIKLGLLPGINSMAIIGLISIPGTLTGQILAGASVSNAVKYQEIVQ
jgi:ABC-type iron transport system FetAB permease component